MSDDLSPFAAFELAGDDPPAQPRTPADLLDEPTDADTDRAWAEEVAERVVALWSGRAEVTPIASTLAEASERARKRHHR